MRLLCLWVDGWIGAHDESCGCVPHTQLLTIFLRKQTDSNCFELSQHKYLILWHNAPPLKSHMNRFQFLSHRPQSFATITALSCRSFLHLSEVSILTVDVFYTPSAR